MPVTIPSSLPAKKILEKENVFLISEERALRQDIRPMRIAILNLMPTKIATETQLLRLLGNTPLQVEVTLIHTATHVSKNTSHQHLLDHYVTLDQIGYQQFDGLIITGAPVEQMDFEAVDYWQELQVIFEWSQQHVIASLYICWAAQAALYSYYGIPKYSLKHKVSGIFEHQTYSKNHKLLYGFDEVFCAPHSRYTTIKASDISQVNDLTILAASEEVGVYLISCPSRRAVFVTGHPEYDQYTLKTEYERDLALQLPNVTLPVNYFPNNNPHQTPIINWKSHANLLFSNWMNHYVYHNDQTASY
jgi:homoserine O-succinyltransferase